MFLKKKKFYTLLDIKNKIIYTPIIFILILAIISFISIFLFLEYEKRNKINTLIQNENYYNNDVLKNYISNIKYNTSVSFDDVENELSKSIYETIGFIKANLKEKKSFDMNFLLPYLKEIEKEKGIKFLVFENINYQLLYGEDLLNTLIGLTNSQNESAKFKYYMLRNIEYIGDNNLMYSIDNEKRNIQLSYIKFIDFLNIYIGAYSKIDDMKLLTKKVIFDSIVAKSKTLNSSYFYFYDIHQEKVFNYNMSEKLEDVTQIKDFLLESKKDFSFTFPKYQYKVFIKTN